MAKNMARRAAPPKVERTMVTAAYTKVREAATWLGMVTAMASNFPTSQLGDRDDSMRAFIRDTTALSFRSRARKARRGAQSAVHTVGSGSGCLVAPRVA
eukprot:1815701-Karenia_brevis.AAC.1